MRLPLIIATLAVLSAPAYAHFHLDAPANVTTQDTLGDPQKTAPCGGAGTASNMVTAVQSGSMITISITETIFHPGHYRVSLAQNEAALPPEPTVTAGATQCGSVPIEATPTFPVLADGLLVHTAAFSGQQTMQVQLPAGMECQNCVLQVLEFMSNHAAPCFYHHCATVNVTANAPTPDAGALPGVDAAGGGGGGGGGGGSSSSGGCSTTHSSAMGPLVFALGLILMHRRRRTSR